MLLNELKGIGQKTENLFEKVGVSSVEDLLEYYPRYYDVFEKPVIVRKLDCDRTQAVKATVVRDVTVKKVRNLQIVTAYLRDSEGYGIKAIWFNAPYLRGKLKNGDVYIFRGFVRESKGSFEIEQPKIFTIKEYTSKMGEMQPVYPLTHGLTNTLVQKSVAQALNIIDIKENLPVSVKEKYSLEDRRVAIKNIHFPKNMKELSTARKRLVFDEFFEFINTLRNLKDNNKNEKNILCFFVLLSWFFNVRMRPGYRFPLRRQRPDTISALYG